MPGQNAPGRRKLTIWMDGKTLDRYRAIAAPRSLAGVLARAVEAEIERLEGERRPDGGGLAGDAR